MAALCVALSSAGLAAQAHQPSDAFLNLTVHGAQVEQRLDIALRDLDRVLSLDADDDGQLTWGEVRGRWAEIERLADAGVRVAADGRACETASRGAPQLESHSDGTHAVLRRGLRCAAPVSTLAVDYRLFADSDATHRGIARIVGVGEHSAVLVPGAPAPRFAAAGAPAPGAAGGSALGAGGADGTAAPRAPQGFLGFVAEGMHHIAIGLDHVLFLVTLLMVAVWRRDGGHWVPRGGPGPVLAEALRLVTAFTVAHSLTLGLAAAGVLSPPSRWVESLIAASVLLAAVDNLWPLMRGPRWAMAGVFGLVHGFGFAGPLQDLGLQRGDLALPLFGFNLGVELGQLVIVAIGLPLAFALRDGRFYRLAVVRGGSAAIAGLAGVWMVERGFELSLLP